MASAGVRPRGAALRSGPFHVVRMDNGARRATRFRTTINARRRFELLRGLARSSRAIGHDQAASRDNGAARAEGCVGRSLSNYAAWPTGATPHKRAMRQAVSFGRQQVLEGLAVAQRFRGSIDPPRRDSAPRRCTLPRKAPVTFPERTGADRPARRCAGSRSAGAAAVRGQAPSTRSSARARHPAPASRAARCCSRTR